MTKKFISLFLSFALVFSLLGTTAFAAANDLEIEGDTIVCENAPGSEISYHVNLKTNPGFTSGKITVSWDRTALKLKEVVYSAYPNASSPPIPNEASSYVVSFGNDLNWCSVKISDTDFVEFPSIKSVSCSSMLPF